MVGVALDLPEALARPHLIPTGDAAAPSDAALLARIGARDEDALLALYDRYYRLLFALALRVVGEPETAEEVLQDVFVRVWNASDGFDLRRGNVTAWLFGIPRSRPVDVLRSRHHRARQRERDPLPDQPRHGDGFDLAEWA